jgi:hypothetical protein
MPEPTQDQLDKLDECAAAVDAIMQTCGLIGNAIRRARGVADEYAPISLRTSSDALTDFFAEIAPQAATLRGQVDALETVFTRETGVTP